MHHSMIFTLLYASSEFSLFNTIPLSFFFTSQRTRMSHTRCIFIFLLILLSGDIRSNPGPVSRVSSLNMCTPNIRSFINPLHYTAIADLTDTHNIDVFAPILKLAFLLTLQPPLNYFMLL